MALSATNSFMSLESKYNGFVAPETDIVIDGDYADLSEMAIEWVDVELTTDSQADVVRFSIANAYIISETRLKWIGSEIQVGKTLQVKLGYADKKSVVFDGLITGYTLEYAAGTSPSVIVTAMDRSFLMMRSSHSMAWSNMKDSDVVMQIAGEYGLSTDIDATTVTKARIEQTGVSDYHFIRSLAVDNNRLFYVTGSKLYFKQLPTGSPVVTLQYGHNLLGFTLQVDASGQMSQVKVRGYDVANKQFVEGTANAVTPIGNGTKTGPSFAKGLSGKKVEIVYSQAGSQTEAELLATSILERHARELVTGYGESIGLPEIMPGRMIAIGGLGVGGGQTSQLLRITKVKHRLDSEGGYRTTFEAEGNAI